MWLPVQKKTECNKAACYLSSIHTLNKCHLSFQNVNMRTEMTEMWFADNDYELWRQKLNLILDCLVKLLLSKLKRSFQAYNLLHLHQDNQRINLLDHIWLLFFDRQMIILMFTHLYGSISRPRDKPLIPRLHSDGPHPAEMTTDDLAD